MKFPFRSTTLSFCLTNSTIWKQFRAMPEWMMICKGKLKVCGNTAPVLRSVSRLLKYHAPFKLHFKGGKIRVWPNIWKLRKNFMRRARREVETEGWSHWTKYYAVCCLASVIIELMRWNIASTITNGRTVPISRGNWNALSGKEETLRKVLQNLQRVLSIGKCVTWSAPFRNQMTIYGWLVDQGGKRLQAAVGVKRRENRE